MSPLAAIAALVLLGASAPSARWVVSEGASLELLAGGNAIRATLSERALWGPRVELRHSSGQVEGTLWGAPVLLTCERTTVSGTIGEDEANLSVTSSLSGLVATGTFVGYPSELKIGPRGIRGRLGGCTYTLEPTSRGYLGVRVCAGPVSPMPTSLLLPRSFGALPVGEQVALLALVLANPEAIEPFHGGEP